MSETLELTKELIRRRSVTPDDAGCQRLIAARLQSAGFAIEHLRFGEVDNLWAILRGGAGPTQRVTSDNAISNPGRPVWSMAVTYWPEQT